MSDIIKLNDVYVYKHGIICDNQRNIIDIDQIKHGDGANGHVASIIPEQKYKGSLSDEIFNNSETPIQIKEPHIHMLHAYNIYVWGHFTDRFQCLEFFDTPEFKDTKIAMSRITSHVSNFKQHMEILGVPRDRMTILPHSSGNEQNNTPVHFDTLYTIRKHPRPAFIESPEWLQKKYIHDNLDISMSSKELIEQRNKLYLSRNSYRTAQADVPKRRVNNEEKVISFLLDRGYKIIDGSETLTDLITLFAGAEKIIYPHGSLVRNFIFTLNKDVNIFEFHPAARIPSWPFFGTSKVFISVAKQMGLKNAAIIACESDRNENMNIDLTLLKQLA